MSWPSWRMTAVSDASACSVVYYIIVMIKCIPRGDHQPIQTTSPFKTCWWMFGAGRLLSSGHRFRAKYFFNSLHVKLGLQKKLTAQRGGGIAECLPPQKKASACLTSSYSSHTVKLFCLSLSSHLCRTRLCTRLLACNAKCIMTRCGCDVESCLFLNATC